MARYRKVDPRIWNDEKFRALSDDARLVFFMLLTHPNMTALGAMRATVAGLAEELQWSVEAFRKAFAEVLQKDMAEHDAKACLIALPNFVKYNPPESPNVVKAWESALDLLPECDLKTRVIARAKDFAESMSEGFAKALPEAFAKTLPKSMPNQEQEQEQDKNTFVDSKPSTPPCPHQAIIDLYHEILPELQQVIHERWDGSRKKSLQARWRESPKHQSLEFWKGFFTALRNYQWYLGANDRNWKANLAWIVEKRNFDNLIEKFVSDNRRSGTA